MKKFAFAAIAGLAFMQSAFALESPLNTSLIPFTTLVDSPKTQNRIPQNAKVRSFNFLEKDGATVYYRLEVKLPRNQNINADVEADCGHHHHHHSSSRNNRSDLRSYLITFTVSNDGIGGTVYTLDSIRPYRFDVNAEFSNQDNFF